MSSNDLTNIVKKMLEGAPATFLDVDMTWNLPNELIISNQMLILMMSKICSIPILPNTDVIYNSLNVTPDSAIQDLNAQFNTLQLLSQKYCVQQFTLGTITHQLFDDMIDNSIEISNGEINNFMNIIGTPKFETQTGGSNSVLTIVNFLFILLLLVSTNTADIVVFDKETADKTQITQYLNLNIIEKDFAKSKPVNMELALKAYDDSKKAQRESLLGLITSLVKKIPTFSEKIQEYISKFNKRSINISDSFEKACTTLMIKSYENHVFKNWNDVDDIYETKRKLKELNEIVHVANEEMMEGVAGKMTNILTTATTSLMSGDFVAPASLLVDYGIDLWDKLKIIKATDKQIEDVLKEEKNGSTALTGQEKMRVHEGLFEEAKFYCSFSFNLQVHYENDVLNVEGDKVDYMWMVNLIKSLQENIDMQTARITSDVTMDEKTKEVSLNLLESLEQRFDVLKTIIQTLSGVVNYGTYASLTKKIRHPTDETLDSVISYFDEQLSYLNNLLDNLQKQFPKQEEIIQQNFELTEEKNRLRQLENEVTRFADMANNLQKEFESERIMMNMDATLKYFKTSARSYIDFGVKTVGLASEGVEKMSSSILKLLMSPPLGMAKSLGDVLLDLLMHLLLTPGGLVLAGTGMLVLFVFFKGPLFSFIHGGKRFIYFVINGVIFVYQAIKTTFGYVLRPVATFVLPQDVTPQQGMIQQENNNALALMDQVREEGEASNPNGGRKYKKRQPKKTKKKQTNKKKTKRNKRQKHKHTKRKSNKKTKGKHN